MHTVAHYFLLYVDSLFFCGRNFYRLSIMLYLIFSCRVLFVFSGFLEGIQ